MEKLELYIHSFLTSSLDRDAWPASRPGHSNPKEKFLVPMEQEAGCSREPVWTLRRREKYFVPACSRTTIFLAQPVVQSLYRLRYSLLYNLYKAEWNWKVIMKFYCMQIFTCWDCGFESHRRHGCLSVVSGVCFQVQVSATSWSLVQRSLPTVMRRCVLSSNLVNEEAMAR